MTAIRGDASITSTTPRSPGNGDSGLEGTGFVPAGGTAVSVGSTTAIGSVRVYYGGTTLYVPLNLLGLVQVITAGGTSAAFAL